MSNSSLVSYKKISPNKTSPRNHTIDTVTIHCVVGELSVETMGTMFAQSGYEASCNYAIGSDGRIALIVEEKDRSWCTSNRDNDNRAITIECASGKTDPYPISDTVMNSLISLLADICKRNGIAKLLWEGDKSLIGQVDKQNMTVHRWFANKACPGDYIYNRLGKIATAVNNQINGKTTTVEDTNIKGLSIGDSNVEAVSKVVYAEAGIIKSTDALVAVAQCIHDMLESGEFGNTISSVMSQNCTSPGSTTTDEARQAVYDVFFQGKRRFTYAKILQFRSFTKYSDGKGNMDETKCASLLKKYEYLGKDARDDSWGHLYFGHKVVAETKSEYKVQVGSYAFESNAVTMVKKLKAAGFDSFSYKGNDEQYKVQVGSYTSEDNAKVMVKKLKAAGFTAFYWEVSVV